MELLADLGKPPCARFDPDVDKPLQLQRAFNTRE